MKKLLKLLEKDAHISKDDLALMCEKEVGDIKKMIDEYEKDGVILGYTTVIDWSTPPSGRTLPRISLDVEPIR